MTPVLLGQILGIAFASGLNIYATVAALGILSRIGVIHELPPALHGLQSTIIIGSALTLYLVEAIIDRVHHADSLWDTVHTFVRPPAAALLVLGTLWAEALPLQLGAAALAFVVALAAHGTKAGFRVAINAAQRRRGTAWISTGEDVLAVLFVIAALEYPAAALAAGVAVILIIGVFGPGLWRAFALGIFSVAAWVRTLFAPPGWREADDLPRRLRSLIDEPPLGAAAPRATRAALHGIPGLGAYRNGWLVLTAQGPQFLCDGFLGGKRVDLPDPTRTRLDPGLWIHKLHVSHHDGAYTIYLLRDGPPPDLALTELETAAP
jgi:hypothetical protein